MLACALQGKDGNKAKLIYIYIYIYIHVHVYISLVPRLSPSSALLTFNLAHNKKLGGWSGEFYHVSDVKGREKVEKLIERVRTSRNILKRPRMRILLASAYSRVLGTGKTVLQASRTTQ